MSITGVLQTPISGAEPLSSTKFRVSREYDGQQRRLYPSNCKICNKEFWAPRHVLRSRNFCSAACRGRDDRNRLTLTCSMCKTVFERQKGHTRKATKGFHFCSRKCKDEAQQVGGISAIQPAHYRDGSAHYRQRALRTHGKKCVDCGYDADERMLDVDHEDGNRGNAAIENLKPRCVWCHALKTRGVPKHDR